MSHMQQPTSQLALGHDGHAFDQVPMLIRIDDSGSLGQQLTAPVYVVLFGSSAAPWTPAAAHPVQGIPHVAQHSRDRYSVLLRPYVACITCLQCLPVLF